MRTRFRHRLDLSIHVSQKDAFTLHVDGHELAIWQSGKRRNSFKTFSH